MSAYIDNYNKNLGNNARVGSQQTKRSIYLGENLDELLGHFRLRRLTDKLEEFPILDMHDLHTVFHDDINRSMLIEKLGSNDFNMLVDATRNCLPFMWLEANTGKSSLARHFIQPNMNPRFTRASNHYSSEIDEYREDNHCDECVVYLGKDLDGFLKTFKLDYLKQTFSRFPILDLHDLYTVLLDNINMTMLKNSMGSFNFARVCNASNKCLYILQMKGRETWHLNTSSSFEKIEMVISPNKISDCGLLC